MIDYEEIGKKFTDRLNEFNKESLIKWLEFDQDRELLGKFIDGESIVLLCDTSFIQKLADNREYITSNDDYSSAIAA